MQPLIEDVQKLTFGLVQGMRPPYSDIHAPFVWPSPFSGPILNDQTPWSRRNDMFPCFAHLGPNL